MSKTYDQFLKEQKGGTAVFTFGRFNPPTTGHEKLLKVLMNTASKQRGDYYVFMSHSQDKKKNPLSHDQKMMFMKLMFPKHRSSMIKSKARNALEALVQLHDMKKYSRVVMVVGSDRVSDFNTLLNRYNGEDVKHGFYQFDEIKVVSAGERDPDAEGVEVISASKMRAAVADGNYDVFKMGIPASVSEKDSKKLFDTVAKGMGVSGVKEEIDEYEDFDLELYEALTPAQRRKMALRMKLQARKPGFIRKRQIALKKAATKGKLDSRARKAAINMIVKRFFPKLKKKSRSELSYAERGKISDIVKKKKSVIARFAKRLVKDKRKQDVERRRAMNKKKD